MEENRSKGGKEGQGKAEALGEELGSEQQK